LNEKITLKIENWKDTDEHIEQIIILRKTRSKLNKKPKRKIKNLEKGKIKAAIEKLIKSQVTSIKKFYRKMEKRK
jgi:hypothetical protein